MFVVTAMGHDTEAMKNAGFAVAPAVRPSPQVCSVDEDWSGLKFGWKRG